MVAHSVNQKSLGHSYERSTYVQEGKGTPQKGQGGRRTVAESGTYPEYQDQRAWEGGSW